MLSDFPSGWEGKAVEKDDDSERTKRKIADCTGVDYEVLYGGDSGTVDSKDFTSSDDESISNRVQVHGTESDASETFEVASSEKYRSCLEKESKTYVEKLAEGEDDTKIGDPTFNELSFDDVGDATIAYRLTVPVKTQGYDVDIIADYVLVRVGRATTLITAQSTISPFDVDDLTNYAKIATDRLAAQLNGTPATSGS